MGFRIDLTNQKFNRLLVIRYVGNNKRHSSLWKCKCDCGNEIVVTSENLRTGHTTSCGCRGEEHKHNHGATKKTHGKSKTPIYTMWLNIKSRCNNPSNNHYKYYGGRGIKMCADWENSFETFYEWAIKNGFDESNPDTRSQSIDRIDVNGNYEPGNCRFVDSYIQANNTRKNVFYDIGGIKMTMPEWCRHFNANYERTRDRVASMGWNIEDAMFTPKGHKNPKGKMQWQQQ